MNRPFAFTMIAIACKRGNIFQTHRYRAGNGFAHDHVDLRLASEQSQNLADIVSLKFSNANSAAFRTASCSVVLHTVRLRGFCSRG